MLTLEMIQDAKKTLEGVARVTPLYESAFINPNANVFIKCENMQVTGSFKLRGAYVKTASLTEEEASKGVIACSAGNHAQGVALAAQKKGIKATICMPAGAPLAKVEATKSYGAEVVLVPGVYDDAAAKAVELQQEKGYTFLHPFNDEYVMAGQGTVGLEIMEKLPEADVVFVPIGGGGLISLPAFLIAGLPPHAAIATNKISSPFGTALATYRFAKAKLINLKLAAPAVVAAICGSFIGAQISLRVPEHILSYVLMVILPVSAFLVLNKKLFNDEGSEEITLNRRTYLTATIAAFIVGCYDGFYGPGTGTFLIIAFTVFAHLNIQTANAQAKVINLTTNLTALAIFLYNGQGVLSLGLASAACNMLGGYIGAGLVMKNGSKIARPSIVFVLFLLALKALGIY